MSPTTIIDVARRAGVSPGTVSNALSGKRPVSAAARARIEQAITELGYAPNFMARGLVNQRSHIIAIVVTEFRDLGFYGYSSTLTGIQQKATALGYSLMLNFAADSTGREALPALNEAKKYQADGVIWAVHEIEGNRDWTTTLDAAGYPPIVHLHTRPQPHLAVVTIDNRAGARLAAGHLIEQGAKTIGIITGPLNWWEAQERLAGWREALLAAGLPAAEALVAEGDWLADSGRLAMETLLARNPGLDAVFASNDTMALGALHTAQARGLAVPDDLLLAGFDNTPEAALYWPPLTSVRQGLRQMGCLAVETLHAIIEEQAGAPPQLQLQPELVVRRSSQKTDAAA